MQRRKEACLEASRNAWDWRIYEQLLIYAMTVPQTTYAGARREAIGVPPAVVEPILLPWWRQSRVGCWMKESVGHVCHDSGGCMHVGDVGVTNRGEAHNAPRLGTVALSFPTIPISKIHRSGRHHCDQEPSCNSNNQHAPRGKRLATTSETATAAFALNLLFLLFTRCEPTHFFTF